MVMRSKKKELRTGFTTGTAAAAAAKAAVLFLAGRNGLNLIDTPLPGEGRLQIPIKAVESRGNGAKAVVIKDGGDDPDVTHRAEIWCDVSLDPSGPLGEVSIEGGKGVGRVTKPGLPVEVGQPAINPAPREQIKKAVREALEEAGIRGAVKVNIVVPRGEAIARKTLNPRLGIIGGISILGTRGTVIPFSNQAYKDTITVAMNVAQAEGLDTIVLTTGGRSERFLKHLRPELPDVGFVQVADFFAFSLEEASKRNFSHIIFSCFFGKLLKMAQGHAYTHARKSRIDFETLSRWCVGQGMDLQKAKEVAKANTASQALDIILTEESWKKVVTGVLEKAISKARRFLGPGPSLTYYLFSTEGKLLATMSDQT